MGTNKKILILSMFILLLPCVFAKQGHMKLLSVTETSLGYVGSEADLYLEIRQGSGRVFLDTRPLTKLDTQISTRFAKEIACNYIDFNCDKYDFFYTIHADAPIVGGPSAGSAIALLTISLLEDFEIDKNTSITGTINSGGLVGPVGGIKAKIDAAEKSGIKKVLIPKGERFVKLDDVSVIFKLLSQNSTNETIDLVDYGKKIGVEVVEVSDLSEVVYEFSGKKIDDVEGDLLVTKGYVDTMGFLGDKLCDRSETLKKILSRYNVSNDLFFMEQEAFNLTEKGNESLLRKKYYSAASFCFGANVKLHQLILLSQNLSVNKTLERTDKIDREIKNFSDEISMREINTITDLESYAVAKERLVEAEDYLDRVREHINESRALDDLAYATERLYSAYSWSYFFGKPGRQFTIDKEAVKKSCLDRLSEAEERYQYINFFFPSISIDKSELDKAYEDLDNGNYELCLFKASKAKASVDIVLSLFGVRDDQTDEVIERKLDAARKNLIKEINKNIFPIIGYSYYEYANTLKENDKYSALLYSEYALELSNLDIYFKKETNQYNLNIYYDIMLIFAIGLSIGVLVGIIIGRISKKKRRKRVYKRK